MKKLLFFLMGTLLIGAINSTYGQGTKAAPWPGSTQTYSVTATGSGTLTYEWWVASTTTSRSSGDNILASGAITGSGNSVDITFPSNIASLADGSGNVYVFVKVTDDDANHDGSTTTGDVCSNYRYFTVTPVNDFNAIASDEAPGIGCPDLTNMNPDDASYDPGYTTFTFKVQREYSQNAWDFAYNLTYTNADNNSSLADITKAVRITGSSSGAVSGSFGQTGSITGTASDDYYTIEVDVKNQPGVRVNVKFDITSAQDSQTTTTDTHNSDDSVNQTLHAMPVVNAFN